MRRSPRPFGTATQRNTRWGAAVLLPALLALAPWLATSCEDDAFLKALSFRCDADRPCASGRVCVSGVCEPLCVDSRIYESEEESCDGEDNDCDGVTDEMRSDLVGHCGACDYACDAGEACDEGVCSEEDEEWCGRWPRSDDWAVSSEMCAIPPNTYRLGENSDIEWPIGDYFLMDRFEVTNERYQVFLSAVGASQDLLPKCAGGSLPGLPGGGPWADATPDWLKDAWKHHPVVCVTHAQATAFCAWAGKRLPTGVEWEVAARGEGVGDYPWGSASVEGRANCLETSCHDKDSYPEGSCTTETGASTSCTETAPVLLTDAAGLVEAYTLENGWSPFHVAHMAGNVAEWVAGITSESGLGDREKGTTRGGSWFSTAGGLIDPLEGGLEVWAEGERPDPNTRGWSYVGFRCAMDWPDPFAAEGDTQ